MKNYKLWHVLVAFVLGVVIVSGVFLVPTFTGGGYSKLDLTRCNIDNCDIDEKLDQIINLLSPYTGSLDAFTSFTSQWSQFTGQWSQFTGQWEEYTSDYSKSLKPLLESTDTERNLRETKR